MATRYSEPLGAAYRRMKAALFQPFDLGKWFVVGFASWIAGWSSGGSYNFRLPAQWTADDASSLEGMFGPIVHDLGGWWMSPVWRLVIIAAVLLVVALGICILWINSRGEFVFLDAVLYGRRAIAEPWRVWWAQGDSLFVWSVAFGLVALSALVIVLTIIFFLATGGRIPGSLREVPWLKILIGFGITWIPFGVAALYVRLFLRHFVTPIMFRDRSTTTEAWRTFLPLLRERLGAFVVYGLFVLVVHIGLLLALIPAILLTCCVLGCLLAIPFIGAVVWLPVTYTFRAFGPEFMAQLGPAYDVWPAPVPAVPPDVPSDTAG